MKKLAFTMAGGGQAAPIFGCMARRVAFTMAEILLSLTIIGVVAAITLPSLMGNINERTWNTQRKALHARMSQAIAMMPQLNGYGTVVSNGQADWEGQSYSNITDTAAEAFVTEGLSKVLKINNICGVNNLEDCGLSSTVYNNNGGLAYSSIPARIDKFIPGFNDHGFNGAVLTSPAAFETQNGESILVYYNPQCSAAPANLNSTLNSGYICANFVYDLNGNKGPNTAGKDVGVMMAFYATDSSVVAPMPKGSFAGSIVSPQDANTYCRNNFAETTRVPNIEETIALVNNRKLFLNSGDAAGYAFSSSVVPNDTTRVYLVENTDSGAAVSMHNRDNNGYGSYCIER